MPAARPKPRNVDTIAHGLAGAVLGFALQPQLAKRHTWRFAGACALLANLPDVDWAMALFDKELWLYHHRGLTHSFLGLFLMVPIAMWLLGRWFQLERRQAFVLALSQIAIAHVLLDVLTSFGTMLLYPFSFARTAAGLMFIVDPLLWIVTAAGVVAMWRFGTRTVRVSSVVVVIALWGTELAIKHYAEHTFEVARHRAGRPLVSKATLYPMPTAPLVWSVTADDAKEQAVVSLWPKLGGAEAKVYFHPVPSRYVSGCPTLGTAADARVERYRAWGDGTVVCEPWTNAAIHGCRCYSLKYSLAALGKARFGAYFVAADGTAVILDPEWDKDDGDLFVRLF